MMKFEKIILPGMGSAPQAMRVLKKNKLDIHIKNLMKIQIQYWVYA